MSFDLAVLRMAVEVQPVVNGMHGWKSTAEADDTAATVTYETPDGGATQVRQTIGSIDSPLKLAGRAFAAARNDYIRRLEARCGIGA